MIQYIAFFWLCALSLSTATLFASEHTQQWDSLSNHNRYRISLELNAPLDALGQEIPAILTIQDAQGKAKRPTQINIGGGMREHQHGLPSQPSVTRYLGEGRWQVSGLMFSMLGSWQLTVQLMDEQGWDWSQFEIEVGTLPELGKPAAPFDQATLALLQTLSVDALKPATDPSNPVLDQPLAAELGHTLFFDPWLSRSGQISCASCHVPERAFSDGRLVGQGERALNINVPTVIGVGQQRWLYHDGRRDSLWSQALAPFEAPAEMNTTRAEVLHYFFSVPHYRQGYQRLFGAPPDLTALPAAASPTGSEAEKNAWKSLKVRQRREYNHAFANVGRLLAAYQSRLDPQATRFDHYIRQLVEDERATAQTTDQTAHHGEHHHQHEMTSTKAAASQTHASHEDNSKATFTAQEHRGLQLFISPQTRCLDCHSGPLLSNGQFHNIGTRRPEDLGRQAGVMSVLHDPFNCFGRYSGIERSACKQLRYIERLGSDFHSVGAFRVPSLRNLKYTAPYMHHGQLPSLEAVLEHYKHPPKAPDQPSNELLPIALNQADKDALLAFLNTLNNEQLQANPWFKPPNYQGRWSAVKTASTPE